MRSAPTRRRRPTPSSSTAPGMTVYPGLIDMGNTAGTDIQINLAQTQQGSRTADDAERGEADA